MGIIDYTLCMLIGERFNLLLFCRTETSVEVYFCLHDVTLFLLTQAGVPMTTTHAYVHSEYDFPFLCGPDQVLVTTRLILIRFVLLDLGPLGLASK